MGNLCKLKSEEKEALFFSGEENPLLKIIFPLTDNRIKNESGLRMHFANVLRQFHEYVKLLDEFFSSIRDGEVYFYFIIDTKEDYENIIAIGHLYHRYAVPSSGDEFKRLKGEIVFFADGTGEFFYYKEKNVIKAEDIGNDEGTFEKIKVTGSWQTIFAEFLKAIIINFEIAIKGYSKILEISKISKQEIDKLRQAIQKIEQTS